MRWYGSSGVALLLAGGRLRAPDVHDSGGTAGLTPATRSEAL